MQITYLSVIHTVKINRENIMCTRLAFAAVLHWLNTLYIVWGRLLRELLRGKQDFTNIIYLSSTWLGLSYLREKQFSDDTCAISRQKHKYCYGASLRKSVRPIAFNCTWSSGYGLSNFSLRRRRKGQTKMPWRWSKIIACRTVL